MKRVAFLLSVEEYMIYPETVYCHNDNELLKQGLINLCDYAEQDVTSLKLTIFDEITPKMILEDLEKLVERTQTGDTILFYFAGHGITEDGESYLVLPNTESKNIKQTAIPLRDISTVLRKPGRINIRIYDACHSGQDVRSTDIQVPNSKQFTESLLLESQDESYITLAACKENESSYPDNNFKNGVFTYYLYESLKELNEGEEVLPEILKMKLCDKVKKWCEINGKVQTPTMNSSISGNVSIANRKETQVVNTNSKNDVGNVEITTLIKQLRSDALIDETKHREYLAEYINMVYSYVEEDLSKIQSFNCETQCSKPMDVRYVDEAIKKPIVKYVKGKKYKPRHEIILEKIYEKSRSIGIFGFGQEGELKETIYDIDGKNWPESYVEVVVKGDKTIIPEAILFFYLLPLQMTSCLMGGYKISYEDTTVFRITTEKVLTYNTKMSAIPSLIDELIESLNKEMEKLITKRIIYLQWELTQ